MRGLRFAGVALAVALSARAPSAPSGPVDGKRIAAGAAEVQLNLISRNALRMPKDA